MLRKIEQLARAVHSAFSVRLYSLPCCTPRQDELILADSQPTSSCAKQWAGELLQRTAGIPQEGRKYNLLFLALT